MKNGSGNLGRRYSLGVIIGAFLLTACATYDDYGVPEINQGYTTRYADVNDVPIIRIEKMAELRKICQRNYDIGGCYHAYKDIIYIYATAGSRTIEHEKRHALYGFSHSEFYESKRNKI